MIYQVPTSFLYSNDIFHILGIGAMPFLIGKKLTDFLADRFPGNDFLKEHSYDVGLAFAIGAELVWSFGVEPQSPFDHANDISGKLKDIGETLAGAGIAAGGEYLWGRRKCSIL